MQMPQFRPYQTCSNSVSTKDLPSFLKCKERFPCLNDKDYPGPWEYALPNGTKCGGFRQPSGNSFFPEEMLPSVRAWQELAQVRPLCMAGDTTASAITQCNTMASQVLNWVPTGELWNVPFPSQQRTRFDSVEFI